MLKMFEEHLKGSASQKIKSEIKSALLIYIISTVLSKIILVFCIPFLYLIVFAVRYIIKLVHVIIPKSKDEIELERMDNEEARVQLQAKEEFQRKYISGFEEWKRTKEQPQCVNGGQHE